jgi:hypothetical protein
LHGIFLIGFMTNDQLILPIFAPQMPAGFDGLTFLMQVIAEDQQTSEIIVGGGATFVLIDEAL